MLVQIEAGIVGEELFKSRETETYPMRVKDLQRQRVQPGAKGSSVRGREAYPLPHFSMP